MSYPMKKELTCPYHPNNIGQFFGNSHYIIPILAFSLVAALRWNVGSDTQSYMSLFYVLSDIKVEIGFDLLRQFWLRIGGSHIPLFFCLALLEVGPIYYALKKQPGVLSFYPIFFVLTGHFWDYNNAVRQTIAFGCFVVITILLSEKKYYKAVIMVVIASLFHRSAWVMIPLSLIFFRPVDFYRSRVVQLIIVAIAYLLSGFGVTNGIANAAEVFLTFIGYDEYENHLLDVIMEMNFGFRMNLLLTANVIVILISDKLKKYYNSPHFTIIYNIYFTGFVLYILFFANLGLARFLWYLYAFMPIIMGYAAWYLYKNRKTNSGLIQYALPLMVVLLLMRTGYDLWEAMHLPDNEDMKLYKFIFGRTLKFY